MRRPVIGIMSNSFLINDQYPVHTGGKMMSAAVADVCGGLPLMVPADPDHVDLESLMEACDGFILTGGRPNVHPEEYGEPETEAHGTFDRARDALVLPLVRACVARGQPIFGICRGFQEMNVAFGGSLHPEIRDLPGRDNHRMPPDGTLEENFSRTHVVRFGDGGPFQALYGKRQVVTNTLHGQGLKEPGERIIVDGWAPDGTPEALYVDGAPGFTLSVQWHPEWKAAEDPVSRPLFEAFGEAARDWAHGAGAQVKAVSAAE